MRGIPYYWNYLRKGMSVQRNMDLMFFAEDAFISFNNLMPR